MNDSDMARAAISHAHSAAVKAEQIVKRLPENAAREWAVAKFVAWQVDCLCMLDALGLSEGAVAEANEAGR